MRIFNKPPEKPNEDFFQMSANDVIRGHRMTDKEANERIWREIDQAFERGEKLFKEYLEQSTNEIIKRFKEKENENNS